MQDTKKGLLYFNHGIPFSQDQCPNTSQEKECRQVVPYALAVGSLIYVRLCTRLDIYFTVGMGSIYQSNLGPKHQIVCQLYTQISYQSEGLYTYIPK